VPGGGATAVLDASPQSVPIRRLTNNEFAASVADLFPGFTLSLPPIIADSIVLGYTNLSSSQTASQVRMEQYEAAAQAAASAVSADPTKLTGCNAEATCANTYLQDLAKRAYRRPLTAAESTGLLALLNTEPTANSYPVRLGMAIEGVLLSPNFLFRPEIGAAPATPPAASTPLTPYELATRLSYLMYGSIPDADLMASADSGALSDVAQVATQARRLLALPRSQDHLVMFHEQWLGVDTVSLVTKSAAKFPTFTSQTAASMQLETQYFLKNVLFTQSGTLNDLFLADYTFPNAVMSTFYGIPAPATDWARVPLNTAQRLGILTQGSLLATMAKEDNTDPVRRGKFVLERLLCRNIAPPSSAIVAMFQPLDISKTARDQFTQHRTSAVCATCHNLLDPLGLPAEHYDAIGQWRDTDRGMPIDATGSIDGVAFDGIPALARLLVAKPEVRTCYLAQWFRNSSGRLDGDLDVPFLNWLSARFPADAKVVDLVVALVQSDSFRNLRSAP
jgi:hypothetical protein